MTTMETKQKVKEASAYIEDQCKLFKDTTDIAWKFLLGNSILEQLEKLGILADQGFDFVVRDIATDGASTDVHLQIYEETPKSNGSSEIPLNQPNSSEDLGHQLIN